MKVCLGSFLPRDSFVRERKQHAKKCLFGPSPVREETEQRGLRIIILIARYFITFSNRLPAILLIC